MWCLAPLLGRPLHHQPLWPLWASSLAGIVTLISKGKRLNDRLEHLGGRSHSSVFGYVQKRTLDALWKTFVHVCFQNRSASNNEEDF